jgi:hypothetical protein
MEMAIYSGGIVKNHWFWGDLAIDLAGMSFPKDRYPILEEHNKDKKIGFTGKPLTDGNKLRVDPNTTQFLDTKESKEFQANSMAGFPYQSSVYAKPSVVEKLGDGEAAEVNGMAVKGPMSIWRKSEFKEASVCVFGWDSETQASAFSKEAMEEVELEYLYEGGDDPIDNDNNKSKSGKEVDKMNLDKLKKDHPDLVEELTGEVTQKVTEQLTEQFNTEKEELETKLAEKETENSAQEERILKLEKAEILRQENDMENRADRIWDDKLADSDIAEHLFGKVREHVKYSKYVKDGVRDEEAFSKAIDAEIEDWESKGTTKNVLGTSYSQRRETGDGEDKDTLAEENKAVANDLLELAGQKTE